MDISRDPDVVQPEEGNVGISRPRPQESRPGQGGEKLIPWGGDLPVELN